MSKEAKLEEAERTRNAVVEEVKKYIVRYTSWGSKRHILYVDNKLYEDKCGGRGRRLIILIQEKGRVAGTKTIMLKVTELSINF